MPLPTNRRYSDKHVWLKPDGDTLFLGITEHAQQALGSIEVLELPAVGTLLTANSCCGSIESVKTVSDLIAPLNAQVMEHNDASKQDPELVNDEPYDQGWLIKLGAFDRSAFDALLDAAAYAQLADT